MNTIYRSEDVIMTFAPTTPTCSQAPTKLQRAPLLSQNSNLSSVSVVSMSVNRTYIPPDACEIEKEIHKYFDKHHVNSVDVKSYIEKMDQPGSKSGNTPSNNPALRKVFLNNSKKSNSL